MKCTILKEAPIPAIVGAGKVSEGHPALGILDLPSLPRVGEEVVWLTDDVAQIHVVKKVRFLVKGGAFARILVFVDEGKTAKV
jgi:hypothetical protein